MDVDLVFALITRMLKRSSEKVERPKGLEISFPPKRLSVQRASRDRFCDFS